LNNDPSAIVWEDHLQEEQYNAEVPDPSDRPGLFLSGMSWIGKIEAKGSVIQGERQIGRPSPQDSRQTPSPLG
jgi:hypothetical protein